MRFKFIGDQNDPNEAFQTKEAFGYVFEPGEFVEIDENAPAQDGIPSGAEIVRKLQGNGHFVEEGKESETEAPRRKGGRPRKTAE
jgi:hypothetical protein